ncbi:hypothetical protein J6590_035469 [Homalodisca vitripennis]|nr:hypothetical protein J6590_035469 [Homalodisca vitripennis]
MVIVAKPCMATSDNNERRYRSQLSQLIPTLAASSCDSPQEDGIVVRLTNATYLELSWQRILQRKKVPKMGAPLCRELHEDKNIEVLLINSSYSSKSLKASSVLAFKNSVLTETKSFHKVERRRPWKVSVDLYFPIVCAHKTRGREPQDNFFPTDCNLTIVIVGSVSRIVLSQIQLTTLLFIVSVWCRILPEGTVSEQRNTPDTTVRQKMTRQVGSVVTSVISQLQLITLLFIVSVWCQISPERTVSEQRNTPDTTISPERTVSEQRNTPDTTISPERTVSEQRNTPDTTV